MVFWMSAVLGCGDYTESTLVTSEPAYSEPSIEETELIQPEYSTDEVVFALESLLLYGLPNPYEVVSTYMSLYDEGATPTCPGTNYNFDSPEADNAGCTTNDGYLFAGLGEIRHNNGQLELQCDCRIVTPDGRMIRGAGNLVIDSRQGEVFLDIQGSFLRISQDTNSWLNQLPSTNLTILIDNNEVRLEGGYTINGQAVFFDDLVLGGCEIQRGSIMVRDPSGGWWSWTVDTSCEVGVLAFQNLVVDSQFYWDTNKLIQLVENIGENE